MMKPIQSMILVTALLFSNMVRGQLEYKLLNNWDYQRKAFTYEKINKVLATTNGMIVAVGETSDDNYRETDGLLVFMRAEDGQILRWMKTGGSGNQSFHSVVQNPDGTFTLVGANDISGINQGWMVDVDEFGEIMDRQQTSGQQGAEIIIAADANDQGVMLALIRPESEKSNTLTLIKRTLNDFPQRINLSLPDPVQVNDLVANPDGTFVLVGSTDVKNRNHPQQIWVLKVDEDGQNVWGAPQYYGDRGFQEGWTIDTDPAQGGYIIGGVTNSNGAGQSDMWLIKIDEHGTIEWEQKYGGDGADVIVDVKSLSYGGYAILGHTWSHMPRAKNSVMQIFLTDEEGNVVDKDIYPIIKARGDQLAFSLTESFVGNDLVFAGNSVGKSSEDALTLTSAVTFISDLNLPSADQAQDLYGDVASAKVDIEQTVFTDANTNKFLEAGERGFLTLTLKNNTNRLLGRVKATVGSIDRADIAYWDELFIGALAPDQEKKLNIPVNATSSPRKGSYTLRVDLEGDGKALASTDIKVRSNRPDPANLMVNKYNFLQSEINESSEVVLSIELLNLGGMATDAVRGVFHLPNGINGLSPTSIEIPSLQPDQQHAIELAFKPATDATSNELTIELETSSTEGTPGIRRAFHYRPTVANPVVASTQSSGNQLDIIWTSHDINEFRSVEVNERDVNIKAVALADKVLTRRNFAVLINGRRTQGRKLDETKLTPPKNHLQGRVQQTFTDNIRLKEGQNEVQIVYYSEDGTDIVGKSTPMVFNYLPQSLPTLHVLSIGVAHEDLQYTVKDAEDFAAMYGKLRDENTGKPFKKVNVIQLTSELETTENNIKKALLNLSRNTIKDNDLVVVFMSSHGKVINGNKYVLLPSDYDPEFEEVSTIDFDEDILKRLRTVNGKKLLFVDACHSGSAGSKSFSDAAASKMMSDLVNNTAGLEIFASCSEHEFSYEDKTWANGAFTKAILEAFENKEVEVNGKTIKADIYSEVNGMRENGSDGLITIEELKRFVQERVPYLVKTVKGKPQNPTNKSTDLLPEDMGIFLVDLN